MGEESHLATRRLLALQYFARLPPRHDLFKWPRSHSLLGIQSHLIDDLCFKSSDKLDSVEYKRAFLKRLFHLLQLAIDQEGDDSEAEIDGDLLQVYAELMSLSKADTSSTSQQILYYYPAQSKLQKESHLFQGWNHITVEEEVFMTSRGTTGLRTWEASLRLAAHIVAQPDILTRDGMVVLELGSGSGFLGTLIAKEAGIRAHVHLTDLDGIVLDHLQRTIDHNIDLSCDVRITPLDWLNVQEAGHYLASLRPNLVVAADTIYDPSSIDAFCQVLKLSLAWSTDGKEDNSTPYALIASTKRNEQTQIMFLEAINRHGLIAHVETFQLPYIDLRTGKLLSPSSSPSLLHSSDQGIRLFPSTHDQIKDGSVALYRVILVNNGVA